MKKNDSPTFSLLILYILVFMVVLPYAVRSQTITPYNPEIMVITSLLLIILVLLIAFLLVKMVKNHNNRVSSKLELIEDQYLRPDCPEDALLEISGIISILKATTSRRTKKPAWLLSTLNKKNEEARIKINQHLETLDNTANGLIEFLKTRNSDHTREIKQLYASARAMLVQVKENLSGDEQLLLVPSFSSIVWFIHKEFPGIVDNEDLPLTWGSIKGMDDSLREPGSFSDLVKLVSRLGKKIMEEPGEGYINVKIGTGNIQEQIHELESGLSRILSIEYNRKIHLETKLDEFSVDFFTFKSEIKDCLNDGYPVEPGKEINEGLEKLERIINFIILDYRKYTRVTAGLEKLNERFANVLETQDRYLVNRQKALENMMISLEETIGTSAEKAAAAMQREISERLDAQEKDQRKRTKEIQEMTDMLRDSMKSSMNNLDQEASRILMDQELQLEERNKRIQEMVQETLKRVIEKLEIEYSTMGNKLDEKISQKVDQLDNILVSAAGKIERPTAKAVEKFKGDFAILLEQQTSLVEKQKETASNMQDDADSILGKFKTEFAALLDQQGDIFEKQNNNLREIFFEMQNSADSYVEKLKKDFALLSDQKSDLLEKQKKLLEDMHNKADLNIEQYQKKFVGLLDQQQDVLKKYEETAARIQTDTDDTMEKFKTELANIVENHNNNLKVYSGGLKESVSRLEKMSLFSENPERMKALINYINKNLYLNISTQDAHDVIKRIEGEPGFSESYRKCAIALFDDLLKLEKSYKDQWFWRFMDAIKSKLEDSIIPFYNRKGKTIYDSYFKEEVDLMGLRNMSGEKLKQIVNKQHWGQIWEPLLCWTGFFKVYFGESLENLWTVLNYNSKNIVEVLEGSLGYRIDPYIPMQVIDKRLLENGDVKDAAEHVAFYQEIIHHIKSNERINTAQERIDRSPSSKLIIYVDRLGLVDNGVRICESRLIFYSPVVMKHFE